MADGSAALLRNEQVVCATIEERHSRIRYDGGFKRSLLTCLEEDHARLDQIDAIGLSTCCDVHWVNEADRIDGLREELDEASTLASLKGRVHLVDHHDSHATLAFIASGCRRCIVLVMDGFGNKRGLGAEFSIGADWWAAPFDRQTVYLATWQEGFVDLERVQESSCGPTDVGLAEAYRDVTHFLGWRSYQYAGKTMALAAHGDPLVLPGLTLIDSAPDGAPRVHLENEHDRPGPAVWSMLRRAGIVEDSGEPSEALRRNVAAVLQAQFEGALHRWVETLVDRYGCRDVAFAGGAAMNCVALGKLSRRRPDLRLSVAPAPADTGQGLGNALWLTYANQSPVSRPTAGAPRVSAMLGPSLKEIDTGSVGEPMESHRLAEVAAQSLASGKLVAVRRGRSEYGPRALGNCSLLFDARRDEAHERVNGVKRREMFRPFAASVLAEVKQQWFDLPCESPFMSFAAEVRSERLPHIPGVVHVDGSTRIQTVAPDAGFVREILESFYRLTGTPLILNTSFNLAGEPMVETAADAMATFGRADIDVLVLGDKVTWKS